MSTLDLRVSDDMSQFWDRKEALLRRAARCSRSQGVDFRDPISWIWIKLVRRFDTQFEEDPDLDRWVYLKAKRYWEREHRASAPPPERLARELASRGEAPRDEFELRDWAQAILQSLGPDGVILRMRYGCGLPVLPSAEIAAEQGITPATLRKRLSRMRCEIHRRWSRGS